jgi:cysteine desulfurase / selenocysteine lyase
VTANPEFPLIPGLIHLNHASVAPWPQRAYTAVERFAAENLHQGSRGYPQWLATEHQLRQALARLLNAPSADDIALLKSTSEGLSLVAHGLPWRAGESVVSFAEEFPSNRVVWESLRDQGVNLRCASIQAADPEQAAMALCDASTRLLAVSSVQYSNGLRLQLERLGEFCRARGILLCVDAIQSLGALRFDVQACGADFVAADGHKWLLGPEGLAVFYCRAECRPRLRLHQYGWHMLADAGDFERRDWTPAATAARFECGSSNLLGVHALSASLSLLEQIGIPEIERAILDNALYISDKARDAGYRVVSRGEPERRSGIVTFSVPARDPAVLHQALTQRGVLCAPRGGGIRFSPHFYTSRENIDSAFAVLDDILKDG